MTTERRPGNMPSTPGVRCQPSESVFEAAHRLYGNETYVDTTGKLPTDHPDWEYLGSVTVRPYETYLVYRIPQSVNPSLYETK